MRTTLDIDDDVLQAVKELAEMRQKTAGKILSDLVREALAPPAAKLFRAKWRARHPRAARSAVDHQRRREALAR